SFEHPADPFPELAEESSLAFIGEDLGHPLIPNAKCVRNSVRLDRDTRVMLVSGSNMSGKSTLLRTMGINAVLAMAGAPIRRNMHFEDQVKDGKMHFDYRLREGLIAKSNALELMRLMGFEI